MGDFSRLCGRRPATNVVVPAQFGRSAFGAVGSPVAHLSSGVANVGPRKEALMTGRLHTAAFIQMLLIALIAVTPVFGQGGRGQR
jgi:hypothetical protein